MTPRQLLELVQDHLGDEAAWSTPDAATAAALRMLGHRAAIEQPSGDGGADCCALVAGELAAAGDRAEALLASAVATVRPGGTLVVAVPGWATPGAGRRFTGAELTHAVEHSGSLVEHRIAPGAAARLLGRPWSGVLDAELDTRPGLADAGEHVLIVARTPRGPADRSAGFFASLSYKLVAAGVVCFDERRRLLLVHDSFRRSWTYPGGVVDAGEDPHEAAAREAYEEAGVEVRIDRLLAGFTTSVPRGDGTFDRVLLLYGATPVRPVPHPVTVHPHEIDAVTWLDLPEALDRLPSFRRRHIELALASPGGSHRG